MDEIRVFENNEMVFVCVIYIVYGRYYIFYLFVCSEWGDYCLFVFV